MYIYTCTHICIYIYIYIHDETLISKKTYPGFALDPKLCPGPTLGLLRCAPHTERVSRVGHGTCAPWGAALESRRPWTHKTPPTFNSLSLLLWNLLPLFLWPKTPRVRDAHLELTVRAGKYIWSQWAANTQQNQQKQKINKMTILNFKISNFHIFEKFKTPKVQQSGFDVGTSGFDIRMSRMSRMFRMSRMSKMSMMRNIMPSFSIQRLPGQQYIIYLLRRASRNSQPYKILAQKLTFCNFYNSKANFL